MKIFIIFLALAGAVWSKSQSETRADYWEQFKLDFGKSFDSQDEKKLRENIFWESLRTISHHNFQFRRGKVPFKMGINQFSDLTFDEYSALFTANETVKAMAKKRVKGLKFEPKVIFGVDDDDKEPPESLDWRERSAVTNVKDQGRCGSCYAMATVGSIESHLFIKTGKLLNLSEQEIVDCSGDFTTFGCTGGISFRVFDYVKAKGGMRATKDYPYRGDVGECQKKGDIIDIPIESYGLVAGDDENVLLKAVAMFGPLAVALDINHESFMRYSGGIYLEDECTDQVNHGALLIGYGSENGQDFWIIKNSFGTKWGEDGYLRIARNRGNGCGILTSPIFPILEGDDEGEDEVEEDSNSESVTTGKMKSAPDSFEEFIRHIKKLNGKETKRD